MRFINEEEGRAYLLIHNEITQELAEEAMNFIYGADFFDEVNEIVVSLNSMGGNIQAGYSIFSSLQNSNKKIITKIEGIAASMAGVIFLAGDEKYMTDYSLFMLHDPSYSEDEGETPDDDSVLNKVKNSLKTILSTNFDNLDELMSKETWLEADEMEKRNILTDVIPTDEKIYDDVNDLSFDNLKQNPKQLSQVINSFGLNKNEYIKKYQSKEMKNILDNFKNNKEASTMQEIISRIENQEEVSDEEKQQVYDALYPAENQEEAQGDAEVQDQPESEEPSEESEEPSEETEGESIEQLQEKVKELATKLDELYQKSSDKENFKKELENSDVKDIIYSNNSELNNIKQERDDYKEKYETLVKEKEDSEKKEILENSVVDPSNYDEWMKMEKTEIQNLLNTIKIEAKSPEIENNSSYQEELKDITKMSEKDRKEFYNNNPELYLKSFKAKQRGEI